MNTNTNKISTDGNRNEPSPEMDEEVTQALPSDNDGIHKENSASIAGIPEEFQKVLLQVGKLKRSF